MGRTWIDRGRGLESIDAATLSIGMALDGDNPMDAHNKAKTALDVALGRGGDQAVVKVGEQLNFFGGKNTPPRTGIETTEPLYSDGSKTYCSANTKWYVSASDVLGGAGVAAAYIGTDLNKLVRFGKGKEANSSFASFSKFSTVIGAISSYSSPVMTSPFSISIITFFIICSPSQRSLLLSQRLRLP